MIKNYILYYIKSSENEDYYFKEYGTNNEPKFTTDIDLGLNLNNLTEDEIEHYANSITKQLWKSFLSQNCKEKGVIRLNYSIEISKKQYDNSQTNIFNALKKLTKEEITLLGLEEQAFLYELSKPEDNFVKINSFAFNSLISASLNNYASKKTTEEKLVEKIMKEIKDV